MLKFASSNRQTFAWIVLVLAGLSVHFSHLEIMRIMPSYGSDFHNKRLIYKPELAKAFSMGFDRVWADLYWLMFLQYYGDTDACRIEKFRYAPEYLRLIIMMDPHFLRPYWFASFVLAGDLNRQKEADEILEEGIRVNSEDWSLPYIAGFNQYLFAKDQARAAYYYRIASKRKGAPAWLGDLTKVMESSINLRVKGVIRTWEKIFKNSDGSAKEHARQELQALWSGVYYYAPTQRIKDHASEKLKYFEVDLLRFDQLPPAGAPDSVLTEKTSRHANLDSSPFANKVQKEKNETPDYNQLLDEDDRKASRKRIGNP